MRCLLASLGKQAEGAVIGLQSACKHSPIDTLLRSARVMRAENPPHLWRRPTPKAGRFMGGSCLAYTKRPTLAASPHWLPTLAAWVHPSTRPPVEAPLSKGRFNGRAEMGPVAKPIPK